MNREIYYCKRCGGCALMHITRAEPFRWVCLDCHAAYKVTVRALCAFGSEHNYCHQQKYRCQGCGLVYCLYHGHQSLGFCQECLFDEEEILIDDIELHLLSDRVFGNGVSQMWEY